MENEIHILAITYLKGVGPKVARKLLQNLQFQYWLEQPKEALKIPHVGWLTKTDWELAIEKAENQVALHETIHAELITIQSEYYPALLKNCVDAPLAFFFKGKKEALLSMKMLALVGTRKPSAYGQEIAETWSKELSKQNITIVSGLAYGIDITAHRACVHSGGSTIAVLGSGLGNIYPAAHQKYLEEIEEKGGVISEFDFDAKPDKGNFPQRNRVVAGMSIGTLVIESKLNGGSMLSAYLAHSYNREVFAIPANIHSDSHEGCLALIKRQVAQMVTHPQDVIEALQWTFDEKKAEKIKLPDLGERFKSVLPFFREKQEQTLDEMEEKSEVKLHDLKSILTELELLGYIKSMPGNVYQWKM